MRRHGVWHSADETARRFWFSLFSRTDNRRSGGDAQATVLLGTLRCCWRWRARAAWGSEMRMQ